MTSVRQLIEISHFYGNNKDFVIAGGGNTSFKDDKFMWIKASGAALGNITEDEFVILDRSRLNIVATKRYSEYADEREKQIKKDLFRACVYPERNLRPSVETSFHEIINYNYVVHTHPTLVNAMMCSMDSENQTRQLFGNKALYVPYTDPGYMLFKKVGESIIAYREQFSCDPKIIFLQNHGVFVAANTIDEIKQLHNEVISAINTRIPIEVDIDPLPVNENITRIIPAIRLMLTEKTPKTIIFRHHNLLGKFYANNSDFQKIAAPLTPDAILYFNAKALYIENTSVPEKAIKEVTEKTDAYIRYYKYPPKILVLKDLGFISIGDNYKSADIAMNVFEDQMKISFLSEHFGGPKFMNDREIQFINKQSIDNLQLLLAKGMVAGSRVANKTVVITGEFEGIGVPIIENLVAENANIVIAGQNETKGHELAASLNAKTTENHAIFVKTAISDSQSVKNLLFETVKNFGGLDVFIYSVGEIEDELTTKPEYDAFPLCTKYALEILKLQSSFKKGYFTDIIQIKSPQGNNAREVLPTLAIELMPYCIKVNSICASSYFDDPLWSHPQTGLFVQYLTEGKVSGAMNISEVKAFYEKQIPTGRGCQPKDVLRALYYLIEQEYETGQELQVSGGWHLLK